MNKPACPLKKHKPKIISAAVIVCILAGAWAYGGNYPAGGGAAPVAPYSPSEPSGFAGAPSPGPAGDVIASRPETPSASATGTPSPTPEPASEAPEPSGPPAPAEEQDAAAGDGSFSVTLTVRCDTLLNNMSLLNKEKHELVPEDGLIIPPTTVTVSEGESAFDVLLRTTKQAGIHMAFRSTPIYGSAYIEAVNNLYEFDAGELSGWMYKVNDSYPDYGCSLYLLEPNDVAEWAYTCDLGRDLPGASRAVPG
ncbi:MAG: DUF4430 domain-containing protein [Oscillospiraceae bacterium]|nr:DUF4430 domain-containing protein [Oscillospiraceae bacterium]